MAFYLRQKGSSDAKRFFMEAPFFKSVTVAKNVEKKQAIKTTLLAMLYYKYRY